MFRKLIGLGIALTLLFSLAACNTDLAEYKIIAKTEITSHVQGLTSSNYTPANWTLIEQRADEGKTAVDEATSKPTVDIVKTETIQAIDKVEQNGKEILETEAEDMIELHTWKSTSGIPNNVILVKHSSEYAIFECVVDNGMLWLLGPQYEKKLSVKPNESFRWQSDSLGTEHAFIDIVVRIDDNIVGYAVIKIISTTSVYAHSASILKSVIFSKVDGEYQNITENQVKSKIEKIKEEHTL